MKVSLDIIYINHHCPFCLIEFKKQVLVERPIYKDLQVSVILYIKKDFVDMID